MSIDMTDRAGPRTEVEAPATTDGKSLPREGTPASARGCGRSALQLRRAGAGGHAPAGHRPAHGHDPAGGAPGRRRLGRARRGAQVRPADRRGRRPHRRDAPRLHRGDQAHEGDGREVPDPGARPPDGGAEPEACREEIDLCLDAGADIICLAFAISDYNFKLVESMGGLQIAREACAGPRLRGDPVRQVPGRVHEPQPHGLLQARPRVAAGDRPPAEGGGRGRAPDRRHLRACIPAVYKHHAWEVKQILGPRTSARDPQPQRLRARHRRSARGARGRRRDPEGCITVSASERRPEPRRPRLGAADHVRLRPRPTARQAPGPVRVGGRRLEPADPAALGRDRSDGLLARRGGSLRASRGRRVVVPTRGLPG